MNQITRIFAVVSVLLLAMPALGATYSASDDHTTISALKPQAIIKLVSTNSGEAPLKVKVKDVSEGTVLYKKWYVDNEIVSRDQKQTELVRTFDNKGPNVEKHVIRLKVSDGPNSSEDSCTIYVYPRKISVAANLNVPLYLQKDSRWSAEKLGYSKKGNTIGSAGCAITSISMVLNFYGVKTDPKNLNTWLKENDGYSGGDVTWENASKISNGKVKFIERIYYTHIPADLNKINTELNNGHPVIAQVKSRTSGGIHFIVITGYSGSTYYINDPIYGKSKLSDLYNKDPKIAIYGIRIYH